MVKRTLELEWNSFFATGIWESNGLLYNIQVIYKYNWANKVNDQEGGLIVSKNSIVKFVVL